MKLTYKLITEIIEQIEDNLHELEFPTEMLIQEYETRIRRLELELEHKTIYINKLCSEINLHIDTIKKWEPK